MLKSLISRVYEDINKNEKGWKLMEITNPKSKLALTLAIVSFIIPLGFIIAVIALVITKESMKEIERFNQKGKVFARSAKITSIVSICIHAIALLIVILALGFDFFNK
ncbi:hypothetical protein J5Y03_17315 [Bacillus sp. RG28]|uniref:DUF4190 domain-containing protein n=1 Tax=Gottfriedia endophytica TaxID=2820819 RepID=A0A940SKC1_9BACI|nr:hypothetical protein [Gottfriedia endophytica]MBP0726920.1 hypothetical protein [Gottfriedia endophytica]